jgi:hypothetical protein
MPGVQRSQKAWEMAKKKTKKNEKSAKTGGPGPNKDGSWIIQTHQGRWIDPVPLNPRSNGQKS